MPLTIVSYFFLISIPIYIFYRYQVVSYLLFLNICLYPLILSYIYLCIPSLLVNYILESMSMYIGVMQLDNNSIQSCIFYGHWFTFVFFACYLFSKDNCFIKIKFSPKQQTYFIAKIITKILSFIFVLIIAINFSEIMSLRDSRVASLSNFAEILSTYRVPTLVYMLMGSTSVILWKTKKFYAYIYFLPPIILEFLTLGRTISFSIIVFSYINYVTISQKIKLLFALPITLLLISSVLLRPEASSPDSYIKILATFFSDATLTYLGGILTYKNFLGYGDLTNYLISSFSSILPNFLSSVLIDKSVGIDVATKTADFYLDTMGFSLANNLISEAAFYGGHIFLIISPIIISVIFYFLNRIKINQTFPGFIFFCILVSSLRLMFANNGFYFLFLILVYLMFSYLIWITYLEWGRKIFVSIKPNKA